jgi:rhodanese-related sulfurtransferase
MSPTAAAPSVETPDTPATPSASGPEVRRLTPTRVRELRDAKEGVIVDVREPYERASSFIPGSHAAPLSSLDLSALRRELDGARPIFQCKSGSRSADAARRYAAALGQDEAWSLDGGIDAWRAADLPTQRAEGAPKLDIMRQVQITAGGLTALGTALGVFVHPAFLIVPGFVGCGLVFAGATGWCGMAKLLGAMPWNRTG